MRDVFTIILVLFSMIALLIERSSCFEILVVGLLFSIALELEKIKDKK